jgi:hypothetical protein
MENERKKEFKKVKQIIKENIDDARCGLYDTRNIVGDTMMNLYKGKFFSLDMCYYYGYFEVFGTTDDEFEELEKFYEGIL